MNQKKKKANPEPNLWEEKGVCGVVHRGSVFWFVRATPVPEVEAFLQSKPEVRQVLLCGIEAHVCVSQTALDLLQSQMEVFVLADAVSSQRESDRAVALEVRLRDSSLIS